MAKTVDHIVTRPGRKHGDPDVQIPVAEDLSTVPGIRQREADVSFYSRVHPQETQNIEKAADRQWVWTVYSEETLAHRKRHDELNEPLVDAAKVSESLKRLYATGRFQELRAVAVPEAKGVALIF